MGNKILSILTGCILLVILVSSCIKNGVTTPNPNLVFAGIYNGKDCNGNVVTNVVVDTGNGGNTIKIPFTMDTGSCSRYGFIVGSITANNVIFPLTYYYDACGNKEYLSGTGNLSGNTFTFNLTGVATSATGVQSNIYNCFTGTK